MDAIISSKDNQWVRLARSARDGRESDLMFLEGARLIESALEASVSVKNILVTETFAERSDRMEAIKYLATSATKICVLSDKLGGHIADTGTPQGIFAVADRPCKVELNAALRRGSDIPVALFLDRIADPSNVGAILRSAVAAGAQCIILNNGCADPYSAKSLRASMGAAFTATIVRSDNDEETLIAARREGYRLAATSLGSAVSHFDVDWSLPALVVLGSEAHGVSDALLGKADQLVRIEMSPGVESLNAAVSAGVVLFEARRQNLSSTGGRR